MKKLLSLAVIGLVILTAAESDAGYALFAKRKLELQSELNSLELKKEIAEKEIERLDEQIKRLKEELQRIEESEERIENVTPEFNGIG